MLPGVKEDRMAKAWHPVTGLAVACGMVGFWAGVLVGERNGGA
jgi:hypothetical protein